MARIRPITEFGWKVKGKLADLRMDQREFCKRYGIPENRMADLITGTRKATKYRQKVEQILGIDCSGTELEVSCDDN
ncbi:Rha family transcriptional regulator [Desulfosporosinus sp. PR]|uniref:Rha family transcriptional regulator n=1 Tax=Candidatus Desulfosporosinus nitrosoreducens TaxID=3401928 RepID=UPI0027F87F0C|nr:Rha family transcriptional regulator [Desulfosporosinus sp. PR]MDQ7094599.1 Rha family transcriptional regulator [Desulfosporosinus sp. PR]